MPPLPEILTVLAVNFALCLAGFTLLWGVAVAIKDVSFIDSVWALGMGGVAIATFLQTDGPTPHRLLLLGLCLAWALRLGLHLFFRWRAHGADRRYVRMMAKAQSERGWGFPMASLVLVFALQSPLMWIVSLPVQLGQLSGETPLGPLAWIGAVAALTGILFETVGDAQISRFKADPTNAGKVMDRGLWRYTRHPNYFGDILTWFGIWIVAADTPLGLWALPGPLVLTFLLTRFSGGNIYEHRLTKTRPGYDDYQRRTSPLIPWPPKPAVAAD
jgi:steroid 5-alpha reductase family enzyme